MDSKDNIVFRVICLTCTFQILRTTALNDGFVVEKADALSGPVMSILRKSNPRTVKILVHASFDAKACDNVYTNILGEFPAQIFRFEDLTPSEIPKRLRLQEDILVLYFYIGYQCPNSDEYWRIMEKMQKLDWWFHRVKLLIVTMTTIDCENIMDFLRQLRKDRWLLTAAVTSTENRVTYYQDYPFLESNESVMSWKSSNIFNSERIPNMLGRKVRVTTIEFLPLTKIERDNKTGEVIKIDGFSHEIMAAVCRVLNATYYINPRFNNHFGKWSKDDSNTGGGIIDDVLDRTADICPHGLYILDYERRLDSFEYTNAIYSDQIRALVPKNNEQIVNHLNSLFTVLCSLGTLIAITWLSSYLLHFDGALRDPLMIYAVLIGYGYPARIPTQSSQRFFLHGGMFGAMLLSSHFQSAVIQALSFQAIPRDIKTLEELEASGRNIAMFQGLIDVVYSGVDTTESYMGRLHNRTFGNLEPKACINNLIGSGSANLSCTLATYPAEGYIDETLKNGHPTLTATDPFFESWLSFPMSRGHPLLPHIGIIIGWLQQAGLIDKWLKDSLKSRRQSPALLIFRPTNMVALYPIMTIVSWCYFLSAVVFIFENLWFRYRINVI